MNEKHDLPQEIKNAVHRIDPNAEVYLYGSRARGDAGRQSDWNILLLLSRDDKKPSLGNVVLEISTEMR